MCIFTVSDFDALDVTDADAVLIAGDIAASEKRAESLRMAIFPFVKNAGRIIQKSIAGEERQQKKLIDYGERIPGQKPPGVIVH